MNAQYFIEYTPNSNIFFKKKNRVTNTKKKTKKLIELNLFFNNNFITIKILKQKQKIQRFYKSNNYNNKKFLYF